MYSFWRGLALLQVYVAAAAKSLQSCPTLCDPINGSPPGSPVPGILQARTLEWVAISFSNAWKWKWKWSSSVVSDSSRPHGLKPTRLLRPRDFPGKSTGVGCHRLLHKIAGRNIYNLRYADDTTLMTESKEELKSLLMRVKKLALNSIFRKLRSWHPVPSLHGK